jgi:hypothetical protein
MKVGLYFVSLIFLEYEEKIVVMNPLSSCLNKEHCSSKPYSTSQLARINIHRHPQAFVQRIQAYD